MGETIKLEMSDWLYNAGLVGLKNILAHSDSQYKTGYQHLEFDISSLENFEEKYLKYFIDTYESIISWKKIVAYEDIINHHENNNFDSFDENDLDKLNKYIKDIIKKYLLSNSYKAAYKLIKSDIDIEQFAKELKIFKLKKKERIEDKIDEVREVYTKLMTIIDYLKDDVSKKYVAGKNIVYTIIRNAWDGVCFLNPQTKEKDMYVDYKNYFVEPVKDYINNESKNKKYNCFVCDRKMSNMDNNLSFLNNIGFDVSRKSSHIWDFNNDVAICPICKLVYSCVPAGFAYIQGKGIYVNDNQSMERAIKINNKIKNEILMNNEGRVSTYKALINSFKGQTNDKIKYELADIQVVRYKKENDNDKYSFNILSKKMLKVIRDSKEDLDSLINAGFNEVKTYFYVYELAVSRILNNQNLFTLIHKLNIHKLSSPKDCRFSTRQVISLLNINYRILEVMGYMENSRQDIIKKANTSGYYLREQYKSKGSKDKLSGIAYRLLNALKTSNQDMFMDTLLNCYLYVHKTVPQIFVEALKDDETFKTIGYAFVTGLIEGKKNTDKNGGNNNDK